MELDCDDDDENMEESKDPVRNKGAAAAQGNQMMV